MARKRIGIGVHKRRFGAAFTPATLASLVGWYEASPAYCFSDDAGTVPCVNGSVVAKWVDRSGTNNHLTQTVDLNRPTFVVSGGKNYVRAVGGTWMTPANGWTGTVGVWGTAVIPTLAASTYALLVGTRGAMYTRLEPENAWGVYANANVVGTALTTLTPYRLIANTRAANDIDLIRNGTTTTRTNGTGWPTRPGSQLNGDPSGVQLGDQDIAAVVIANAAASAGNAAGLDTYLASKL